MNTDSKARQRAALILQVRTGQMTATAAAQKLGVSRKTYYQWERRALEAMMESLSDQNPGRPTHQEDPEKAALLKRVEKAEKELEAARRSGPLREILLAMRGSPPKKRTRSSKK